MASLEYPTIFRAFAATAARYPQKIAISFLGTIFTYSDLLGIIESFASGLAALGFGKGDRIVMYIPNSVQFVVSWLAAQRIGAIVVPITPIYTLPDLKYIANDTEATGIICSDRNFGYVKQAMVDTSVKRVIVTNVVDLLPWWKRAFGLLADKVPAGKVEKAPFMSSMKKMISSSLPPVPDPGTGEDDTAEILFTGGTTKHPKGVPISHGFYLVSSEEQLSVRDPLFPKDQDVILGGAPLFHILGQTCTLATIIIGGGTLVLQPRVNLDAVFDSIQRHEATSMIGVPALYRMILEHDRVDQYDLSSLKYCFSGGDVLPVEVGKRWKDRFGLDIYQGYGATETAAALQCVPQAERARH